MAISKVILNGETLIDVTSDTVDVGDLLSGETATKNDGTKITGNVMNGNNLEYGLTDGTLAIIGVAKVDSVEI